MLSSIAITLHLFGSFYFHKNALVFVHDCFLNIISPNCLYLDISLGFNSRSFPFWPQYILTVSLPFPQPKLHVFGLLCIPQHFPLLHLCSCLAPFSWNPLPVYFSTCQKSSILKVSVQLLPLLSSPPRTLFPGVPLLQRSHKF